MFKINKDEIKTIFKINTFKALEEELDNMAPSMVLYHLESLISSAELVSFNRANTRAQINGLDYNIFIDYENDIYIEIFRDEEETASFF
jgi:hypothetical protein